MENTPHDSMAVARLPYGTTIQSGERDSNPRPPAPKAGALPTELSPDPFDQQPATQLMSGVVHCRMFVHFRLQSG